MKSYTIVGISAEGCPVDLSNGVPADLQEFRIADVTNRKAPEYIADKFTTYDAAVLAIAALGPRIADPLDFSVNMPFCDMPFYRWLMLTKANNRHGLPRLQRADAYSEYLSVHRTDLKSSCPDEFIDSLEWRSRDPWGRDYWLKPLRWAWLTSGVRMR